MNFAFRLLAAATLALPLCAQTPENPPPWWRVQDNQTLSLFWNFDTGPVFPPPTQLAAPSWYNPAVTVGIASPNLQILPTLAGRVGVLGLTGSGAVQVATLELTVDNDPQVDWIKIFYFQFDAFTAAGDDITVELESSSNYKRAIVSEESRPLGGGWFRFTVQAQLMPQPNDEGINWTFTSAGGAIGIDNLHVSSKCVKPAPDQDGAALGEVADSLDVTALTGGADCRGIAVTEGPGPLFQRSTWIAVRDPAGGVPHRLLRASGVGPIVTQFPLPGNLTTVPQGPGDLAVETRTGPAGGVLQQIIWTVLDQRPASLPVLLVGVDTVTGAQSIRTLPAFPNVAVVPPNQTLGLAFDPSGDLGNGTFWISSTDIGGVGAMREFSSANGALLDTRPLPPGVTGLGYDDTLGNFYGFSANPLTPTQPIRAHGFELSGYDFLPTGVRFCGDLTLADGTLTGNRGGIANGLEVWRSRAPGRSQLNLQCLVSTPNNPLSQRQAYRLAGPYAFGSSLLGRCGMASTGPLGGIPFLGSTFEPTLSGVPNAPFAALLLGFSNTTSSVGPLPLDLQTLVGWPESVLSVAPTVFGPLLVPSGPGRFSLPIQLPATSTLGYTPVFVQWLVLDTSVPGFFATTQAGKTVLYP